MFLYRFPAIVSNVMVSCACAMNRRATRTFRTLLVAGWTVLGACSGGEGTESMPGQPLGPGPITLPGAPNGANPAGIRADDSGIIVPPLGTAASPGVSSVAVSTTTCARADLTIKRTIPTVWLLIDGSGSMGSGLLNLAGPSRWNLLRDALLAPSQGLIARLERSISFGLMIYDGGPSLPGVFVPGICPGTVTVAPELGNYAAINAAYPAAPLGASTPTHYALEELSRRIMETGPSPLGPTYVVLATDGRPNLCDFHDGIPSTAATEQQAVATVKALSDRGTRLFAISMANGDVGLQAHLQQVAQAGATGQPAFDPDSQDALVEALSKIVGGTTTCDAQVQGNIVRGRECAGDVRLNDVPLACNGADGFRLKPDGKTLELLGQACMKLQGDPNARLKATFACDDVILN